MTEKEFKFPFKKKKYREDKELEHEDSCGCSECSKEKEFNLSEKIFMGRLLKEDVREFMKLLRIVMCYPDVKKRLRRLNKLAGEALV